MCAGELRSSRTRPVEFAEVIYRYARCHSCRSLTCVPMPDERALELMYGPAYDAPEDGHYEVDSPRDTEAILAFLNQQPPGRVVDFGCGRGDLLEAIMSKTYWTPIGVELSSSTVAATRARTGAHVITYAELTAGALDAVDALHLGDVIEHLTDLDRQLPALLKLLAPGGHPLVNPRPLSSTPRDPGHRPWTAHLVQATRAGRVGFRPRRGRLARPQPPEAPRRAQPSNDLAVFPSTGVTGDLGRSGLGKQVPIRRNTLTMTLP
jgi:2-polyprenyl-3-methyl-5-hydroxy-6-metoxy-1,4-benzoquinol methylase